MFELRAGWCRTKRRIRRTLLRRNAPADPATGRALADIDEMVRRIAGMDSLETLLGIEGAIAAAYFGRFSTLLKPRDFDAQWDFAGATAVRRAIR